MSGKSINFDGKNISKSNFYQNKKIFNIYDLDVSKILVSKNNHMVKKCKKLVFHIFENNNCQCYSYHVHY